MWTPWPMRAPTAATFALDSGSPRIQKVVGKHLNIPRFVQGVEMAVQNEGSSPSVIAMLGFPTETEEEMRQTVEVACHSMLHVASFSYRNALSQHGPVRPM
jgi:anaerobic magnesium-protoporphyrin IX monomethyl ester cyclase